MRNTTTVFIFMCLFTFLLASAQKREQHFVAFGQIPSKVDSKTYHKLKAEDSPLKRLAYLDTIAQVFLKTDLADSLEAYSAKMRRAALDLNSHPQKVKLYKAKAWFYRATAQREMGFLEEATGTFIKGIEATNKDSSIQQFLKLGLAQTYLLRAKADKAKSILDKLPKNPKNRAVQLTYYLIKSSFYLSQKNTAKAMAFYQKGGHISRSGPYLKLKMRFRLGIAHVYAKRKQYEKALSIFKTLKPLSLEQSFYKLYIQAVIGEGRIFEKQKRFSLAEAALNTAYVNSVSSKRLELQKKINRALVKLYVAKKDYKNAYSLMTQYASINYRIAKKQNSHQVRELETKYESLQKEREIQSLQKKQLRKEAEIDHQKTIKNAFLIGFLVILIPTVLLLVVYYQKLQAQSELNKQQEELNRKEMQAVKQAQELNLARTAVRAQERERRRIAQELHDSIGGNLAAIKLKIDNLKDKHAVFFQIMKAIDKTYEQVREISHSLMPKTIREHHFADVLHDYIDEVRQDRAVNIQLNIYPQKQINALSEQLQVNLFNIIKELMTNAFKHAKASEIHLQLSVLSEDNSVALLYEDDGVGFQSDKTQLGIGLTNIKKRVEDLKGTLSINSQPNQGTVVSINISKF